MTTQENINYNRIAEAIDYIKTHFKEQPSLEDIAKNVHVSPFHFQRLFSEWAGVSPKKFMQYISIEHAKNLLKDRNATLMETAFETGLSSTGRLHDMFISIEGMTPGEYKNGGKSLNINFSYSESPFGNLIIASTRKGICHMAFMDNKKNALHNLQAKFPNSTYNEIYDDLQDNALSVFSTDWRKLTKIKLHLNGSPFQLKVWEALLKIPKGNLTTYGKLAKQINNPNASRAVGTAIGNNPIAFLIPCHRVIQASGNIGNYMWGNTRKTAIIGWEACQVNTSK